MKNKLIYGLIAGTALTFGLTSCDNDEFLNVTHYSILPPSSMVESDEGALATLTGCYDLMLPSNSDGHNGDPFKPYVFTGSHPTMDSQASGWDKAFMTQSWDAQTTELQDGWNHAYAAIQRCNDLLDNLGNATDKVSDAVKKTVEGEARALRGYQYFWLATTFGRVPMLATGENYNNTPSKARAATYAEMWDFIIEDFAKAADLLDWAPYQNQYGRCTKGMALAYLGDSYMWEAYRYKNGNEKGEWKDDAKAAECYKKAEAAFEQILNSGTYELNPSFTTLWDADEAWGKEAIWQAVLNEGDQWGGWDGGKWSEAHGWVGFYFGAPANGAWGTYAVSWELYDAYENYLDGQYAGSFDKRRDGSLVTATINPDEIVKLGKQKWFQRFNLREWEAANDKYIGSSNFDYDNPDIKYNPAQPLGLNPFSQEYVLYNTFHREPADPAPTVYSTKHWRNGRGTHWQGDQWLPDHIYMKRLPNVMLDYAECRFINHGANDAKAWEQINKLRARAFGNLEVGKATSLTDKYSSYFKNLATVYGDNGSGLYVAPAGYPIPFNTATVNVPDAETYYTALKAEKGFASPVWKVAVNEERRKEFNAEWCLKTDLQKSDYLVDHIEHNYPKTATNKTGKEYMYEWKTNRDFDFSILKMDMPIPQDELLKNPACDQNPAYVGNKE